MASEFPQVHRRTTRPKLADSQRNSSVVRASVLETALELGFGQNSTVADWIFNNPISEEAEDSHLDPQNESKLDSKPESPPEPLPELAEATSPSFSSGSDESSSLNSSANVASSAVVTAIQVHEHKPSLTEPPHVHFGEFSSDQLQLFSPFVLSPHDVQPGSALGGSFVNLPRGNERSRSQDDDLPGDPTHEDAGTGPTDSGYTSEGQYLSKGKTSKGQGKSGKSKGNKDSRSKTPDNSKSTEKDGDYASDGGYISASSNKSQGKSPGRVKSRAMAFFRRRPKKVPSDDEDDGSIPPVPALPVLPRPSSPKPLERRAAPLSPTRPGFSPLTLNLTNPPASPRRRISKGPPPAQAKTTPPKRLDHTQRPTSPPVVSTSMLTVLAPAPAPAATIPLPPSAPGTPLSTTSCPSTSAPSAPLGGGTGSTPPKSHTTQSSRQLLNIPPPAPPPTLPLPQPPPSPSALSSPMLPPTTPSRRGAPTRPIPVVPASLGSTQPLTPRRTASPLRPLLSPRAASYTRTGELANSEGDLINEKELIRRQRSGTTLSAGFKGTPAFLQRRLQYGPPPSPRHPPPDTPLPPSPCPIPSTRPRTPVGTPSKFHEHFSSVSTVPVSQVLTASTATSPSPSTVTLSESSSGPSVRSSHVSSASERNEKSRVNDSLNVEEHSHSTRASIVSESSNSQPPTSGGLAVDIRSQSSGRSDASSSIYVSTMPRASSSVSAFDDDDDADVEDAVPKSCVDETDDDASVYPSDDKTAGRRTMYLVEHGESGEGENEITGSRYWGRQDVPPVPPLPPMLVQPGPGYF